jgi:hypothetical protein
MNNEDGQESIPQPIEDAIAQMGRLAFEQPAICTGWVLVTEWFGGKNEFWVMSLHDDQSPPWRHSGMMDYAQTRIKEEIDEYLYPIEGGDIETDTED